jgi:hypothetical protein
MSLQLSTVLNFADCYICYLNVISIYSALDAYYENKSCSSCAKKRYMLSYFVLRAVKQGGIVKPKSFCIQYDGLLSRLHNNNVSYCIGNIFISALANMDDLRKIIHASSTNCIEY